MTWWSGRNFVAGYLSFIAEMKSHKDTRYKQSNCRPDYILERIDIWCRFRKLRCFVIRTWPTYVYLIEASSHTAPEGQSNSSLRLTKWYETFHLCIWSIYVLLWDKRLPKLNVFRLKHLLEDWFVSRRTSLTLKSEWSNYTQVPREFYVPKNSFHMLPRVLKA